MKKIIIGIFALMIGFNTSLFSQVEKEIKSKVTKVTVFTQGAQLENEAKIELPQGKCILSFTNLSPYINKESIRIDGEGNYLILNVQLHNDYINELEKNKEIVNLNTSIQQFNDKIEDEETAIKIINDKIDFLKSNKNITGKDQSTNPETFKSLNIIYGENIEKYSLEILKRQRIIKDYTKELDKLNNQLSSVNSKSELPSGTITIMVDSKQSQTSTMKISYLVTNASWYPTYDIRFINTNKPITFSFKANINQNTGVDWNNVDLKLSTAKTNISAQIPSLVPNYLNFISPIIESALQGTASGVQVTSNSGKPGSDVMVRIRGVGTFGNSQPLFIVDGVPQNDIESIKSEDVENMEVLKDASATAMYGSRGANGVVLITTKNPNKTKSKIPMTITSKNETSNEYMVNTQQSIKSDNKLNTITFRETELKATYEYQSIPKLSKNVFLIGKLCDWYKADLIDGEANLYLENSFVGKTNINTQQFTDTLDISFGIDNNISVNREKIKDFSESKFIGSNKKETFAWKLTIRNNKPYPIKTKLFDQIPISSIKDIQVETLELSGGQLNANTGKIQWLIDLQSNETKQIILKYSVEYPKEKLVIIE